MTYTQYLRAHPDEFAANRRPELGWFATRDPHITEVDLDRCVVLADLCWHSRADDRPITPVAVETKDGCEHRIVCYPDDPFAQYWVEVAPTFTELLRRLSHAR